MKRKILDFAILAYLLLFSGSSNLAQNTGRGYEMGLSKKLPQPSLEGDYACTLGKSFR
jgi:hypothetical protein